MSGDPTTPLRLENVSAAYGARPALHDIGLEVPTGQFVALVGPNGSGKTTLLRVALGFLPPASGSIALFGNPVQRLRPVERARRVAWVPQEEAPRDNVRLLDYVLFGRYAHLRPLEAESREDRAQARRALTEVALGDRADDGVLSLSGGERQRALLARALVQEAPLLLLDEPTSHLDIGHQLDLLERVRRLSRERKVTVVTALHDLNLAARYADRIVVLARGRLVADGPPSEVISAELLIRVWGVVADLKKDPRSGTPYLVPQRLVTGDRPTGMAGRGPVHVIGGGGAAGPYLRMLTEAGFRATAGALNLLDTDAEIAEELGVPAALEVPFAPLGAEVRGRLRELLGAAEAVVVAPIAVGPSNLPNLEELLPYAASKPIFVARRPFAASGDFTQGRAAEIFETLRRQGAVEVTTPADLLERLATPRPTAAN